MSIGKGAYTNGMSKSEPRITRPARRHRIGDAHIRAALANADDFTIDGDMVKYFGQDDRGIDMEVGVVPDNRRPGRFAIIHAMPRKFLIPRSQR
ncbi:Uncharacterised protein [Mycobacteroides abscessus subsp. massiliense]|nr:Uncharacterised protein [Mycobacteroides abscessus subsp. massiliense]SKM96809.1 Uncharacterised protein [Mycobacteroides abscessus subsp. massiliense]SKN75855.1 Uncharacterised protein [Mycobacteroides abscessus subsp. massiliense]SKN97390.1 Uncharacterised protein [Mycobacteroides abscessus subsp. massiliense]SKO20459.1 Uncharacterised protein [Mycobacteroides abscessus subsp. massiliense]